MSICIRYLFSIKPIPNISNLVVCFKGVFQYCHDEKSKVMDMALEDYQKALARRGRKCIIPVW